MSRAVVNVLDVLWIITPFTVPAVALWLLLFLESIAVAAISTAHPIHTRCRVPSPAPRAWSSEVRAVAPAFASASRCGFVPMDALVAAPPFTAVGPRPAALEATSRCGLAALRGPTARGTGLLPHRLRLVIVGPQLPSASITPALRHRGGQKLPITPRRHQPACATPSAVRVRQRQRQRGATGDCGVDLAPEGLTEEGNSSPSRASLTCACHALDRIKRSGWRSALLESSTPGRWCWQPITPVANKRLDVESRR